ncbi:MAG: YicC/YloC family endoribonuclease [Gemmatimonadaceae bacterium]
MTGFGTAEGRVGATQVSVELRSVNHRFFNPSIKLPGQLSRWEPEVREALRKSIARGHVTVMARIERMTEESAVIDEPKFAAYVKRLMELKDRYALEGNLDLATVLRLPDVIRGDRDENEGGAPDLVAIVDRAAAALNASRESEGQRLQSFLTERIAQVDASVTRLAERAPQRIVEQHERLRKNVADLTSGVQIDQQRLVMEIALLADRFDVGEELDRFRSHLAAFRQALAGNGKANGGVGKRLGFLLQELLREANTTGSKSNDTAMTREVLSIKEELERIREQVENLE